MKYISVVSILVFLSCSTPQETHLNPPLELVAWKTPNPGATYQFTTVTDDSMWMDTYTQSKGVISTEQSTLTFYSTDETPATIEGTAVSDTAPALHAESFGFIHIALDTTGDFWFAENGSLNTFVHYPGLSPTTGIIHAPIVRRRVDSTSRNGSVFISGALRRCLGWRSLTAGGVTYRAVLTVDSQYSTSIAPSSLNAALRDTSAQQQITRLWFVPSIGCYGKREVLTFVQRPGPKTESSTVVETLTEYTP